MAEDPSKQAEPDTVKLISADGHEFIVDRKAAMISGTIKSMLTGPGMHRASTIPPCLILSSACNSH